MKYSRKGHKHRKRHKNKIIMSGQARLVYVININRNIPTKWRWDCGNSLFSMYTYNMYICSQQQRILIAANTKNTEIISLAARLIGTPRETNASGFCLSLCGDGIRVIISGPYRMIFLSRPEPTFSLSFLCPSTPRPVHSDPESKGTNHEGQRLKPTQVCPCCGHVSLASFKEYRLAFLSLEWRPFEKPLLSGCDRFAAAR